MTEEQLAIFEARLVRIESMLAYMLGTTPCETEAVPTVDQARQLVSMGIPAWRRLKRSTNRLELWQEGFQKKLAAQDDLAPPAHPVGAEDVKA